MALSYVRSILAIVLCLAGALGLSTFRGDITGLLWGNVDSLRRMAALVAAGVEFTNGISRG